MQGQEMVTRIERFAKLEKGAIQGKQRGQAIHKWRQLAAYLLRHTCGMSYPQTGLLLNRDHTTVISAVRGAERRINSDELYREQVVSAISKLLEA